MKNQFTSSHTQKLVTKFLQAQRGNQATQILITSLPSRMMQKCRREFCQERTLSQATHNPIFHFEIRYVLVHVQSTEGISGDLAKCLGRGEGEMTPV